ncbi:gamma-glutamyltransferase, partial [Microbacteriaceae bacterium K1510]|nr:gamma-glutamyltransferase [Microbacteriaceae bacterium K1510]
PKGTPLAEGDLLVQPDLAKTLKLIKAKGVDVFYQGEIGQALINEVQKRGGMMTIEDLKSYTVKEREPVRANFRSYEVVTMSPPSSGGLAVLQILKLMEGFNNETDGVNSAAYLHHLIEAMHLAYADRAAYMA